MPDLHFLLSTEDYPCLAQELCKVLASQQTPSSQQVQCSSPSPIPAPSHTEHSSSFLTPLFLYCKGTR